MNKLIIIGNLTRDPELRSTPGGMPVCNFTVAVNRRKAEEGRQEADFFRVTAWDKLGELCNKYLTKGRKVCVVGRASASAYTGNDGTLRASLEITAQEVEFLSPRGEAEPDGQGDADRGFVQVEDEELPFA